MANPSIYWLGNLLVGRPVAPPAAPYPAAKISKTEWTLQRGIYTPRQIVQGFAPLLDTIVHHFAPDHPNPSLRAQLLHSITALLSTDTQESSLPFPAHVSDSTHREIRDQARRVSQHLVQWATESVSDVFSPDLTLHSRCEGHLLTPENSDLMLGPRSNTQLMTLMNEYMHQMVLLRDALLPFQNYEYIPIPISGRARGMRHMEGPREQFMTALFTKQLNHASIFVLAKALLAPNLPRTSSGGYGFQYDFGTVIPAFLAVTTTPAQVPAPTPLNLLQHIPAQVDPSRSEILFDYEFEDSNAIPRVEIAHPGTPIFSSPSSPVPFPAPSPIRVETATLGFRSSNQSNRQRVKRLNLGLTFNTAKCVTIDVGQIARGWRSSYPYPYSSYPSGAAGVGVGGESSMSSGFDFDFNFNFDFEFVPGFNIGVQPDISGVMYTAQDILLQHPDNGLVSSPMGGLHVITADDRLTGLAVLGRLSLENVVRLARMDTLESAVYAGSGFGAKFVVWGVV